MLKEKTDLFKFHIYDLSPYFVYLCNMQLINTLKVPIPHAKRNTKA